SSEREPFALIYSPQFQAYPGEPKIGEPVIRYGKVSLCHIAARRLDLAACIFLTSIGGNGGIPDTGNRSVIDYAKLYQEDDAACDIREKAAKAVFKVLRKSQALPPELPQAFYILHQEGYEVMYNPSSKCPIVREVLYEQVLVRNVDPNKHKGYRQNPSIPPMNRASIQDFKAEGVICGHAKPRADALSSDQALYDVGYLTNILAQDPILNNGLWKKLETVIRKLVQTHLCLHIYTGGVFTSINDMKGPKIVSYRVIGRGEVSMPTHLFKVVYAFDYGIGWRSLAYLIPNQPLRADIDLQQYVVSVQRIQELTGVDFLGFYANR
ncbi:MAG TPA: DNA/RNA non-specific endonuclease, partial [Candidatus Babeliaceae bacterium]|nr:DNA/RNA non-specific endonuclease [Candidatus Babeliaceae bacterium]